MSDRTRADPSDIFSTQTGKPKRTNQDEMKRMKNQFDELTKSLAQSVTRRAALKRFGVGLASMALACFGLANKSKAATFNGYCEAVSRPHELTKGNKWMLTGLCIIGKDPATGVCVSGSSSSCPAGEYVGNGKPSPCNIYWSNVRCSLSS